MTAIISPCLFFDDCYKIKPKLTPEMLSSPWSDIAYYADHQAELERDIEDRLKLSMRIEKETGVLSKTNAH